MFYSFLSYGLQDALYILQAVDGLQIIYDHLYIFAIVNSDFDATVEDAIVAADGELVYVDIELVADDTAHVEEQSLAVDAFISMVASKYISLCICHLASTMRLP